MKMQLIGVAALLCASIGAARADGEIPNEPPASVGSRIFFGDTSTYDPHYVLGRIAVLDVKGSRTIEILDKAHSNCEPDDIAKTPIVSMPSTRAYYFVVDKTFSASLSFFTFSADMSDSQRQEIVMDDIATVDIESKCVLSAKTIFDIAKKLPNAAGKKIFYITGATLSHLTKQTYSQQDAGGGISAGSWLSIGGSNYKGSQQIDSVPVIAVRGYSMDIPEAAISSLNEPVAVQVQSISELGAPAGFVIRPAVK